MDRMIPLIVVLAVAETAWALLSAVNNVNLVLFYAVLIAASAVFFIPGITGKKRSAQTAPVRAAETNR